MVRTHHHGAQPEDTVSLGFNGRGLNRGLVPGETSCNQPGNRRRSACSPTDDGGHVPRASPRARSRSNEGELTWAAARAWPWATTTQGNAIGASGRGRRRRSRRDRRGGASAWARRATRATRGRIENRAAKVPSRPPRGRLPRPPGSSPPRGTRSGGRRRHDARGGAARCPGPTAIFRAQGTPRIAPPLPPTPPGRGSPLMVTASRCAARVCCCWAWLRPRRCSARGRTRLRRARTDRPRQPVPGDPLDDAAGAARALPGGAYGARGRRAAARVRSGDDDDDDSPGARRSAACARSGRRRRAPHAAATGADAPVTLYGAATAVAKAAAAGGPPRLGADVRTDHRAHADPEFDLVRAVAARGAGLHDRGVGGDLAAALVAAGVPPAIAAADERVPLVRRAAVAGARPAVRAADAARTAALRARRWRVPAVATGDVLLLHPHDHEAHRVAVTAAAGELLDRMSPARSARARRVAGLARRVERRARAPRARGAGCGVADELLENNAASPARALRSRARRRSFRAHR